MTKIQKTMLFSLLLLIILYILWNNKETKKPIPIKPITIAPIIIKKISTPIKITEPTNPSDILLKLKIATKQSQRTHEENQEALVNKILDTLQKQANNQIKVKQEPIVVITKIKPKTQKTIVKAIEKPKVTKVKIKEIEKIITKPILKIKKKIVVEQKIIHPKIKNPTTKPKYIEAKAIIMKMEPKHNKQLSREEEVTLYKSKYANNLEVVGSSENFEIEEIDNSLPDSYYFETQAVPQSNNTSEAPLNYVEKLGVVKVSNIYEVNFTIDD